MRPSSLAQWQWHLLWQKITIGQQKIKMGNRLSQDKGGSPISNWPSPLWKAVCVVTWYRHLKLRLWQTNNSHRFECLYNAYNILLAIIPPFVQFGPNFCLYVPSGAVFFKASHSPWDHMISSQASLWSPSLPPSHLETWKIGNSVTRKLGNSENWKLRD